MKTVFAFPKVLFLILPLTCTASQLEVVDNEQFSQILDPKATVETLAEGIGFGEGPVWVGGEDGHLLFTEMERKRISSWTDEEGVKPFIEDSGTINSLAIAPDGTLYACDSTNKRLARIEEDRSWKALAEGIGGKRFNSTNDLVVGADGTVWFTDPWWGAKPNPSGPGTSGVYRFDPSDGSVTMVADDNSHPNGIALSPDGKILYVAQSGKGRYIKAYDVLNDKTLGNPRELFSVEKAVADGIKCDALGNIWATNGAGVEIRSPQGELIGRILTAPRGINLCFGGPDGKTVFITTKTSLLKLPAKVAGAAPRP